MVRENRMDRITDRLRLRVDRLLGTAHKQFKGSNPYRQEPVSDTDRIDNYMKIKQDPQLEQEMRQSFGDVEFDNMEAEVRNLINRELRDA